MKWLTAANALADVAYFMKYANKKYFDADKQPKWITFGGSYSGTRSLAILSSLSNTHSFIGGLSAWMRQMYPELVIGAISSSGAPMEVILDYPEYIGLSGDNLALVRQSCWDATKAAFDIVGDLMKTRNGRDELKQRMKYYLYFETMYLYIYLVCVTQYATQRGRWVQHTIH
jgi:hypothetical protein